MNICFLKKFEDESINTRIQSLIQSVEQEFPRHWKKLIPQMTFYLTSDTLTECPEFMKGMNRGVFVNASPESNANKAINSGMVLECHQNQFSVYAGSALARYSDEEVRLNTCYKVAEAIFILHQELAAQFLRIFEYPKNGLEFFGTVVAEVFVIKPPFDNCSKEIKRGVKRKFSMFDQCVRAATAAHTN